MALNEFMFDESGEKPSIEESFGIWTFIVSILVTMNYYIAFISAFFGMGLGYIIKKWFQRKKKNR